MSGTQSNSPSTSLIVGASTGLLFGAALLSIPYTLPFIACHTTISIGLIASSSSSAVAIGGITEATSLLMLAYAFLKNSAEKALQLNLGAQQHLKSFTDLKQPVAETTKSSITHNEAADSSATPKTSTQSHWMSLFAPVAQQLREVLYEGVKPSDIVHSQSNRL